MSWLLPSPPNGMQSIPSSEKADQESRFYGEDIWFEIAAPDVTFGAADYVITADGDWAAVTGREALRQSLMRRLVTNPGEWQTKPDYGVGARQYVKAKNTPEVRAELETRIRSQFLRDARVERVDTVLLEKLADGTDGLRVAVTVTPRGRLRSEKPLAIQLEIR